jgi:hypothetical protein
VRPQIQQANDTPVRPYRGPLRHDGPCSARREKCWLEDCRAANGDYAAVEVLASRAGMCYGHGEAVPAWEVAG